MGPLALFAMGAGNTLQAIASYRQSKKEKKYLRQQIIEIERQKRFLEQMSLQQHGESVRQEELEVGGEVAEAAQAGIRTSSGSAIGHRQALRNAYGRSRDTLRLQTNEQLKQMTMQQYFLSKRAKAARKSGRLNLLASLLGSGAQIGMGAYKSGMFADLFGKTGGAAARGAGAYGGTGGGGPTGGGSRSMIG